MSVVAPYCGQTQQTVIQTPASIAYRQAEREDTIWVMPPYAQFYPDSEEEGGTAYLPPPIYSTDLWSANQTFPL